MKWKAKECDEENCWCQMVVTEDEQEAIVPAGAAFKDKAKLIAAAPELLHALEDLVKAHETWNAAMIEVIGRPPKWGDEHLNNARAAIKKARGGDE